MVEEGGGFLSRWSARKAQSRQGEEPPAEAPRVEQPTAKLEEPSAAAATATEPTANAQQPLPSPSETGASPATAPAPPPPTLEDVATLTPESDFSRFVATDVDPSVRNAAMKKLFAAPSFNTMDGLDVYTEDFNTFEPLPKATLRQMLQARVLGLLDDELTEQPLPHDERVAEPEPAVKAGTEPIPSIESAAQPEPSAQPPSEDADPS